MAPTWAVPGFQDIFVQFLNVFMSMKIYKLRKQHTHCFRLHFTSSRLLFQKRFSFFDVSMQFLFIFWIFLWVLLDTAIRNEMAMKVANFLG